MSTPIVRIKITELDTTTAARAEDSLDVVYVPGLSGLTFVSFSSEATTDNITKAEVGDIFTNLATEKSAVCTNKETTEVEGEVVTSYEWETIDFIAPMFTEYKEDKSIDLEATEQLIREEFSSFQMIDPIKFLSPVDLVRTIGSDYYNDGKGSSIDYAYGILDAGLPVLYHCGMKYETSEECPGCYKMTATEDDIRDELGKPVASQSSCFHQILDHNEFDVKYITSGVYSAGRLNEDGTSLEDEDIMLNMIDAAQLRGDAFAIIDSDSKQSVKKNSLYNVLSEDFSGGVTNGEFAAAFAPWGHYSTPLSSDILLPPSYAYLICYADSIRSNGSHLAIAGTTRGLVNGFKAPDIPSIERLNNAIADSWQDLDSAVNVNAITYIRNYGYCIWGNRTLHNNAYSGGLVDTSFLNIRNMLCDIKKRLRNVAVRLLFEQNNDVLWSRFLFGVSPIFERLKASSGISGYKIIREHTDDKTKLKATIKIVTIKPLEQVEVAIVMTDADVSVE